MEEFKYVFQVSKLIMFEVEYYTLGGNENAHFSTSANEFTRSKKDYTRCGQAQEKLLGKGTLARRFFDKWDRLHLNDLTSTQYAEILKDIEELKDKYNYMEMKKPTFKNKYTFFDFYEIVKFSKQEPKN